MNVLWNYAEKPLKALVAEITEGAGSKARIYLNGVKTVKPNLNRTLISLICVHAFNRGDYNSAYPWLIFTLLNLVHPNHISKDTVVLHGCVLLSKRHQ